MTPSQVFVRHLGKAINHIDGEAASCYDQVHDLNNGIFFEKDIVYTSFDFLCNSQYR